MSKQPSPVQLLEHSSHVSPVNLQRVTSRTVQCGAFSAKPTWRWSRRSPTRRPRARTPRRRRFRRRTTRRRRHPRSSNRAKRRNTIHRNLSRTQQDGLQARNSPRCRCRRTRTKRLGSRTCHRHTRRPRLQGGSSRSSRSRLQSSRAHSRRSKSLHSRGARSFRYA